MADFDIQGARAAGYSDQDIIGHLASTRNFDVDGARKAGYSDDEILSHLAPSGPTAKSTSWLQDVGHTVSNWWDQVNPAAQARGVAGTVAAIGQIPTNPAPAASIALSYGQQGADIEKRAEAAFKKGDYGEGVRHVFNYLLHGVGLGTGSEKAGDELRAGDYWGGAGTTLGVGTNVAVGAKAPQIMEAASNLPGTVNRAVRGAVPNVNNPVEEAALRSVEPDVPMSVGQRSGNVPLQRVEQGLENVPGSSTKAQQFYQDQQAALSKKASDISQQVSPTQTNAYGAGQAVQQRLTQRISRLKGQADKFYDQVRQDTAANTQTIQTGTTQSPVLGPQGQPIQTPVMQTLETPVDLAPVRQQLTPIYEDLQRSMPDARRAASPAFKSLQDLMTSDDQYMNAMDFDKSLSAIKSLARDGQSPYLTSKSQALAKQVVAAGEQQLNQAIATAGPDTLAKLQSGRRMVRAYHDTADLLQDLNTEPAALYSNLTTGGDRVTNTLQQLQRVAPTESKIVGRTFLEGMIDKATKEGGFARAPGIMADWNRLGPETKTLMFGRQAADIDNFMLAAKRLTANMNPSGTAKMAAAFGSYGAAGAGLWALLTGQPLVAGGVAAGMAGSRLAAELLLSPGGAAKIASTLPAVSVPGVVTALGANAARQSQMPPPQAQPRQIMPPPGQ